MKMQKKFRLGKGKLYIFPVSDLHIGHKNFNERFFNFWEDAFDIAQKKIIYLLGDIVETPSTRVSAYDTDRTTEKAIEDAVELLEPYKKYMRIAVSGNHELRLKKDFDLDITANIASRLGIEYSPNDFFDTLCLPNAEVTVYGKHGTKFSKSSDLAMKTFKEDMKILNADLCLQGHNHYTAFSSDYIRNKEGGHRRYYGFTGHFLQYNNSYAHNRGNNPSPAGFLRLAVDKNGNIGSKCFHIDEEIDGENI